jgi:tetratricopeptide (TPR) repeat protein
MGQIHFAQGDWVRWGADTMGIFQDADKSGMAVQTYWRYRLADAEATYFLQPETRAGFNVRLADYSVQYDPTQNPELRFFRGLLNVRQGDLTKAKLDSDYILSLDSSNPSYRALAAYVAALAGDKSQLQSLPYSEMEKDPRALRLLGEAAHLSGDNEAARRWWVAAGRTDPQRASLTCLAGENHSRRGDQRIATALLIGCTVMLPNSKEENRARSLLATFK